jgi:hypothetical protein
VRKIKITSKKSGQSRGVLGNVQNVTKMNTGIGPVKGVSTSYSRKLTTVAPKITRGNNGKSCRIAHRELILASIPGSTTFTVQSVISLNPGLSASFPWLAPQAGQWEQYKVHKLNAIYTPLAPTSTQGTLTLSPDYDASDPTPTTETQLSDNLDTVEDSCWQDIECVLDVAAMMGLGPRKYVRPCAIAGDIKTFDVGKLFVASNNETGTTAIGKLWLDYDFEFFVPQNSPNPDTYPQQTSFFTRNANETFTSTTAAPLQFDSVIYDPLNFGPIAAGVFTPPAGVYRIEYQGSFQDSSNEEFVVDVQFLKNSATLLKGIGTIGNFSVPATGGYSVSIVGVIAFNGTDTFEVSVTLDGTSGTLLAVGANQQLVISLA